MLKLAFVPYAIFLLFNRISKEMLPDVIAHGHIHHSNGIMVKKDILFSNAACSQNIIEL